MIKPLILATSLVLLGQLPSAYADQSASSVQLSVELPRLQVAEYHKPYVAVWLEDEKRNATHVKVWYDVAMENEKGEEWLADLRQWWRRGGRKLDPCHGLLSRETATEQVHAGARLRAGGQP